jgi:hypothetical protein
VYILTYFIAALGFLSESKAHLANRRALAVSKRERKKGKKVHSTNNSF